MNPITSTTEEKVPVYVNPTTSAGAAAQLDGRPTLEVVEGNATVSNATQQEADDHEAATGNKGLAGYVISEDTPGSSVVKVSADADLGTGVQTIQDVADYSYGSPLAKNLGASAGTAVLKNA